MIDRTITTDRLVLRPFRPEDCAGYTAFYTGPRTQFVGGPVSCADAAAKFCAMIGHWTLRGFGRFAICRKGATEMPIGHAGLMQMDLLRDPEMTWTLWSEEAEGQGYAREAVKALCDDAEATYGFKTLTAMVHQDNDRSIAIANTLGFVADPSTPAPFRDYRAFRRTSDTEAAACA